MKQRLRQLVDELPDTELDAAQRYLEYLRDTSDPLLRKLLNSPDDEEELTQDDLAAAEEAEDDFMAGRVFSQKDIQHERGP